MRQTFNRWSWVLAGLMVWPFTFQAAQFKFPSQTLTVPEGFEVELVAVAPLVDRPVSASLDEQGRLYVTDSSGSNDKPDKQLEAKPHRVVRLEDTDGDGRFDKTIVFADKMMFPEGCLWHAGSLYVAAPPSIWKLTDTDNDGIADQREEWHQGKTLTGCANDLHGPYLGQDGLLYWCKGAFATQTYELPRHNKPFVSRAAHIFRARPSHSGMEPVLTGGMDNPVGVGFTPEGERILCGTFFVTHEPGHRDGLIHAIYGGVYGKINDATDGHKKTGDLMPIMTHMGPAAPCSVIRYESQVFGNDYQNNVFVCAFNLHKVSRHVLEPDGATFKTRDSDFVTSDNTDFHPTDIIEDADGSLLIVDTGGWYKICCPTSQLSKPDVLGAIYRVRRTGAKKVVDPRGLKLAWDKLSGAELAKLLDDERPAVCNRAIHQLGRQGVKAISDLGRVLNESKSTAARRNALWALTRIGDSTARHLIRSTLDDKDESVRLTALHSVSLWRDFEASSQLIGALSSPNPHVQRIAAEALGRIGANHAVPALLKTCDVPRDRVLEHSLIYALIEIADPEQTRKGLTGGSAYQKRAALIALDQMDGGDLIPESVASKLRSPDPLLRQTAAWVAGHHPDWGDALATFFRKELQNKGLAPAERNELSNQLAQFARSEAIQEIITLYMNDPATPTETRQVLLEAMTRAALKETPGGWVAGVTACLNQTNQVLLPSAVGAARVLSQAKTNAPNFSESLLQIARNQSHPEQLRLEALTALPNGLRQVEPQLLHFLCASLSPEKPVAVRSAAANVLAKAKLSNDQLVELTDVIKTAGPIEMTKLLSAFEKRSDATVGHKLLEALKESKGLASLRPDLLASLLAKYPAPVQEQGKELLVLLNVDTTKQAAHLDELLPALKEGDVRRGQAIFNGQKAACASCHTMGYLGGKVGPDLTSIGQARTERDLLESIVYPSASFVRSYEPFTVATRTETEYSGVLRKDADDEVILATGPDTEVRIARSDITEMRPGRVSVMPAGLDEQLTKQELADLLAFLKSTKWGPR